VLFRSGNDVAKALRYAQLAAEQAVGRAAYTEATGMLEAGLKLLDKLPEGVERLRAELELRSIESTVVFVLRGNTSPEFERLIRHMCELGEKIGEADQLLRGLIPLSMLHHNRGEPVRGLELARRCLELAEDTQDAGLLADARWAVGFLALACGDLREAVSNVEVGMRLLDRTSRRMVSARGILYRAIAAARGGRIQVEGGGEVGGRVKTPEQEAREEIDRHLWGAGWMVQHRDETNLAAGRGIAIREFRMAEGHGNGDYLLYTSIDERWVLSKPVRWLHADGTQAASANIPRAPSDCSSGPVPAKSTVPIMMSWMPAPEPFDA